ncbi:cilia- and flagella-associated protein 43 [Amyelois transitella]|uniref:cilia- and flagella-associated protein 43 n=1 Tax=Amyelois transitella TaxID=680683 RepID=UPI00298F95D3|nr:cilia- and flagella-associated protein 43 [Amyelois transitella]
MTSYNMHIFRWAIPHRLDAMTFVGRDVFAVAHDIYIIFLNLKLNTELVYVANNEKTGDGVDVIAGHKTSLFAFAEKVRHPRILVMSYPNFKIVAELKDPEVLRYKGVCMMDCDLVAGFSGFPHYSLTVWSWRTRQRLVGVSTGVVRRSQIYMSSRTHMLLCECYGEGLIVWEVAQCYKTCLIMKREKKEVTGWELSDPPFVGVCWNAEGQLYVIDPGANLYSILSDGIGMVSNLEWSSDVKGTFKPCICSFGSGLLIYGPDNCLRSLKKFETQWKVVWQFTPQDEVVRLISNTSSDMAAMWTDNGCVYKVSGESEEKLKVKFFTYKQRNVIKIQLIAPDFNHIAMINDEGTICIYEILTAKLVAMRYVEADDVSFQASPTEPILAVFGQVRNNYGLALMEFKAEDCSLVKVASVCLTHQIVSQVAFSPTGREFMAAAMSAGHIFIYKLTKSHRLKLIRYAELGRGLADCFMMKVGETMRSFSLVLFSDKYAIGERIICIDAETGKDNKFAGKMQGPYARLLPLSSKDTMLGIPHLSKQYHVLKLSGEKGITVSVKMGPIIDTGHDMKYFNAYFNEAAFLSFGYDGTAILRQSDAPPDYDLKLVVTHRYETGIQHAAVDVDRNYIATLAGNHAVVITFLEGSNPDLETDAVHATPNMKLFEKANNLLHIIGVDEKNYLDLQEDKKVHEEAMDYQKQRQELVRNFESVQERVVALLEENLVVRPLHQLSLSEFNLHLERKKERIKEAEREREEIRLNTEALIRAQDKVTAWIKKTCWDTMLSPRVKLFAIFSHYQVENYAVLPTQRDRWPELQQSEAMREVEMENDEDLFKPWEEIVERPSIEEDRKMTKSITSTISVRSDVKLRSQMMSVEARVASDAGSEGALASPHVLSGSGAHHFINLPPHNIPQLHAYSFLHMHFLHQFVKLNVQNMRLWFNKQFDDLMTLKKREVGLVEERNARLRFIVEELNKLSDLRGSFHHLMMDIRDPEWRQEEQPYKLIKVEPEECSIEPYISPSQVVIPPPEPKPKDDFKERALIEMMDGVLEKLWHEEIKKPVPLPQCMLEKDPEHFNEDDLRFVFDYEAKVAFRNEERDKYRKMLHAEYAKLSQVLNEGVVKFNQRVKEMWLTKLAVDSVIGQENLNLMRLRRTNLDRVENDEKLDEMRAKIKRLESEVEFLTKEQAVINEQVEECNAAYEALAQKDKMMERSFKNHFADLSPIIVDQCFKFYKKRPKWHQRVTMTPLVLYELANAVLTGVRPPLLHVDCVDYFKGVEQLDLISNMPPVMDEGLWATMCRLRRTKIENEIRMRAVVQELAYVESAGRGWLAGAQARRRVLADTLASIAQHREDVEFAARNRSVQLVLPAGQVEIVTTGHMSDFDDATLILKEDIEKINNLILRVGELKLRMMRKQMEFRKGILSKEWEHAQMKMKLRHMEQELYSYKRLKIPKELQLFLKNKEKGYTDEMDFVRMEKEMEASKISINKVLAEQIQRVEELELKIAAIESQGGELEKLIANLNVKVSEKRLNEDPLDPIRKRRIIKNRLETLVLRSALIREVQTNHTNIVLLQTELELLRLKTYPTLASFRTLS